MKTFHRLLWPRLAQGLVGKPLTEPATPPPDEVVEALAARVEATARARLGRSLSIRQVDAGSCNGCELEVNALNGVLYDLERFGLRFVASPRHADVLLVTGPVTRNMREALNARGRRRALLRVAVVRCPDGCLREHAVRGGFRGAAVTW